MRQALDTRPENSHRKRIKGSGTFVTEPKLLHESTSFITGYREESRKIIAFYAQGLSVSGRKRPAVKWQTPSNCMPMLRSPA